MRKMAAFYLVSLVTLLVLGCAVGPFDREIFSGAVGGIRISLETVDSNLNKYSVISASFTVIDPKGKKQFTNWTVTPGTNKKFDFQSTVPGVHYMVLTDIDSLGDTNVFATNANLASGNNYKILVTLGADLKNFGIYSETLPLGVTWGSDVALDVWSGAENVSEVTTTFAEGTRCYRIAPTYTGGWWGIGIRPNPGTAYKNMKTYSEGSLRFYFRGTKPVKVGVKLGPSTERWMNPPAIFSYGLKTNDTWCAVTIPFTNLAPGVPLTNVSQYFMVSADTAMGYVPGSSIYYIDNIHWCNRTN